MISEVYITFITEIIKDMIPVAFFVFAIRLMFNIVYSALNGRLDI